MRVSPAAYDTHSQHGLARLHAVKTRPSTVAAQELFSHPRSRGDWKDLPFKIERLVQVLENWDAGNDSPELSCAFSADPKESRRQAMTASVMAHADNYFLKSFERWFRYSLSNRQAEDDEDNMNDDGDSDKQQEELKLFHNLRILGWIRPNGLLQPSLGEALHATILKWVRNCISGEYEEEDGLYSQIQDYQRSTLLPWLSDLVGGEPELEKGNWVSQIDYSCAECYCLVRNDEVFELVADYPDSHPAVEELRSVLDRTKLHTSLGQALKDALIRRLNHPGANTSQIIDVYIHTIQVLREIDSSDRLLQAVTEPVRSYLRRRQNTVRCIITSLTDPQIGGELYDELRRQDARPLEHHTADSDDEEEPPDLHNWQPPPPLTKKGTKLFGDTNAARPGSKQGGDILSMLVSIYGSKELFVNEYRIMLADKLLANLDFATDKEVHTLELLKLRFGELSMRNCEIMIKDVDDSKRIISNIMTTLKQSRDDSMGKSIPGPIVDAAMISHIFWPVLQNETFKHHPRLQAGLDEFASEYARLKNPRRLVWMKPLGTVELELDVLEESDDGTHTVVTREFSVTPLLSTLIVHFEDKEQWTSEELSNETGLPEHVVQKRMAYWVNHRVVTHSQFENHSTYRVATQEYLVDADGDADNMIGISMDEDDAHVVSAMAQEEEEMDMYESYISGMLTNMGQLPLERIHNMLKMFVTGSDVKYNKTPQQLSVFLQHLCKQDKLECGPDGMYKLLKK